MNQIGLPIVSLLIFVPIVGALCIPFFKRDAEGGIRLWTAIVATVELALAAIMAIVFNTSVAEPQLVDLAPWIPSLGISYFVAVDGLNLWLVILTAILTPITLLASWYAMGERTKEFCLSILALEGTVIGALVSFDLILYFVFWEAMLIPMCFLIGVCGGSDRVYASIKFFLYTTVGSLVMLLAILALYYLHFAQTGSLTMAVEVIARTPLDPRVQIPLFLAFALAFSIKIPLFPFHTWLPDAYGNAPITALVLGTMLVKVGAYSFIRFCLTLFPSASIILGPLVVTLAVIGILYAAWVALGQGDVIRLLAYSSMAHLSFIVLGIFAFNPQGVEGALIQMFNHGVSAGALFLLAAMLRHRTGTLNLRELGGLGGSLPVFTSLFLLVMFSYIGLPGLNGFVGELLILVGSFQTRPIFTVLATFGVVLSAVYMLNLFRRAMQGPASHTIPPHDLTRREAAVLVPFIVLILWIGLYPATFLRATEASVKRALVPITTQLRASTLSTDDGGRLTEDDLAALSSVLRQPPSVR